MNITMTSMAVISMGIITFLLRAFPTIVPKKLLQSSLLIALNFALPISVMMVLILASLSFNKESIDLFRILSEILALIIVLLTYFKWRNVFVSVIIGVATLNGFIWLTTYI